MRLFILQSTENAYQPYILQTARRAPQVGRVNRYDGATPCGYCLREMERLMDIASQGMPRHDASGMRFGARDRWTILDADSCAVRAL